MKKTLILSVILCVSASGDALAQVNSDWQWMHPRPQGNDIRLIKMVTPTDWVAVGYTGTLMRTTNSGTTWLVYTNYFGYYASFLGQGKNIYGGDFFDANTGVVCGTQGWIARTADGGVSWDSIGSSAGTTALWNASFGSANTVYIGGNSGLVLKSTNAGVSWVTVTSPAGGANRTIFALDANTVFAGSLNGVVYKSTNGGSTWTALVTGSTTSIIFGIYFFNADTGIVTGGSGYVRYTTNGGTSWNTPGVSVTATETRIFVRKSPAEVYLLGDVNNLYRSTDRGITWTTIPYQYPGQPIGIQSNTMDIGGTTWVVGGVNGLLNRSTNSGATWTATSRVLTVNNMYGVDVVRNRIWVSGVSFSGLDRSILFSSDNGVTWSVQSTAPNADLRAIDMIDENYGWTCGFNAVVFRTTNGGNTWSSVSLPNSGFATLTSVDFPSQSTGYIFGAGTSFWKTTDAGVNWVQLPLGTTEGVKWADMVDTSTGYYISTSITNTRVYKTTNGGSSWSEQSYPNPGNLWRIKMLDANTGYICGDGGRLYRSIDGSTWTAVSAPTANNYTATDWYDVSNGVLGAGSGFEARTTNGGQSWMVGNTGGSAVWAMKMIHPDTIWSTQAFGYLFRYAKGSATEVVEWTSKAPEAFVIRQNYPNPFNPSTTIEFSIPRAGHVTLGVYDIAGREVRRLLDSRQMNAGTIKATFDGTELSSGVYFYAVSFNDQRVAVGKMVLLK